MMPPPCFYLFIYRKIKEKCNGRKLILHAELLEVLGRNLHNVPKKYHYIIIREMESYKLVKRIDQKKLVITAGNIDSKLDNFAHPIL